MLSCRSLRKDYVTERGDVAAVAGVDLDVRGRPVSRRSSAARARASRP